MQLHLDQNLLKRCCLFEQAFGFIDCDDAVLDRLLVFCHQHGKALAEGDDIGVDAAFVVDVAAPVIIGQGDAL